MSRARQRLLVVGPFVWFANHFPENWRGDPDVRCVDVDEADYRFLIEAVNFRPDISVFYRPELYPRAYIDEIRGRKIAFLSEPVPGMVNGKLQTSTETDLRLLVYRRMEWSAYEQVYYYDHTKRETVKQLGWPIEGFLPLPIDTSVFRPGRASRPIDVCFLGKATEHRIQQLDFLRTSRFRFVWVAHGVSGRELAALFQRSKVVLNIHADGLAAIEPRIYLAAACGACVLSERLPGRPVAMSDQVLQYDGPLTHPEVEKAVAWFMTNHQRWAENMEYRKLGMRSFVSGLG